MFPFTITWMQHELQRDFQHFTPLLPWSGDLGVNVDELDGEHKILLNCLNSVLLAIPSYASSRMLLEYNVLSAEARKHFENEEARMKQAAFADLQEHHEQHEELRRRLSSLHFTLLSSPSYFGSNAAFNSLSRWFVPHLKLGDQKFAEFIAAGKAARPLT